MRIQVITIDKDGNVTTEKSPLASLIKDTFIVSPKTKEQWKEAEKELIKESICFRLSLAVKMFTDEERVAELASVASTIHALTAICHDPSLNEGWEKFIMETLVPAIEKLESQHEEFHSGPKPKQKESKQKEPKLYNILDHENKVEQWDVWGCKDDSDMNAVKLGDVITITKTGIDPKDDPDLDHDIEFEYLMTGTGNDHRKGFDRKGFGNKAWLFNQFDLIYRRPSPDFLDHQNKIHEGDV